MPFAQMKLIETVRLERATRQTLFSTYKVWGSSISYQMIGELAPWGASGKTSKWNIWSGKLFLYLDRSGDDLSYSYVMHKQDRKIAGERLSRFFSKLDAEGWDVAEVARETRNHFNEPKKYWACSIARGAKKVTKQAEDKVLKTVVQDVLLQPNT
jgi:hypothetical protein